MANNPLRTDSNGTANALRSKLQGLGAGTYDPEFMKQYRTSMPPAPNTVPFIPNPNPAENKSQLVKKKMLIYSGDRDDRVGSSASDFQITLNTTLDDVVKLELRSFQVPRGIFNVISPNLEVRIRIIWTRANSDTMANFPPPAYPGIPASITTSTSPSSVFTSIYITAGAYTWEQYANAWAKSMSNYVVSLMGTFPTGEDWITAMVNDDGKIEFYSVDDGLNFFINTTTPAQLATGAVMGLAAGTTVAINTGGVYGSPGYYYMIAPNQMTLEDLSILCVQSIALGNNLVATEGGSAGFNAFATVPIPDQASPILVRFDNTLDSTYFEPNRRPYNTLKTIDFKITDKDGRIINLRSQDITMEFDVVQKITPTTLGT